MVKAPASTNSPGARRAYIRCGVGRLAGSGRDATVRRINCRVTGGGRPFSRGWTSWSLSLKMAWMRRPERKGIFLLIELDLMVLFLNKLTVCFCGRQEKISRKKIGPLTSKGKHDKSKHTQWRKLRANGNWKRKRAGIHLCKEVKESIGRVLIRDFFFISESESVNFFYRSKNTMIDKVRTFFYEESYYLPAHELPLSPSPRRPPLSSSQTWKLYIYKKTFQQKKPRRDSYILIYQ